VTGPLALVVGHVTLDRTPAGTLRPGGSAYYGALALAALGARVRVLTAAAADFPREALAGVEALVLPSPATTTFENAYDAAGRRTQRVEAAAERLDPEALPEGWRDVDLLLLAPVLGELVPAAFTRAVRARVRGLGLQGLVRQVLPGGAVAPRRLEVTPGALAGLDLAVLGEDEALGQPGLVAALAAALPLVAFTRGRSGCDLLSGAATRHVGVHPAREVDPTGAGDVFAAATLLALARGDEPGAAARLGAAAASIVIEGRGGEALGRVGEAWERAPRIPFG
jgi:sugar/nucleoside kinase (ribokinase family)